MPRLLRISPIDVPVHLIQRGNNRQVCFASEEDYGAYVGWLTEYAKKYMVDVHAWVMMSNHVHLLCTPRREGSLSLMMQSMGRRYVRYFNHEYQRRVILGTLLLTLQNTEEKPAKIQYIPATGLRRIGLNSRVMILNSNQKTYMLILMTTRNAGQWL